MNENINRKINTNLYSVNDNKTLENDSLRIEGGIKKQKPKEYKIDMKKITKSMTNCGIRAMDVNSKGEMVVGTKEVK